MDKLSTFIRYPHKSTNFCHSFSHHFTAAAAHGYMEQREGGEGEGGKEGQARRGKKAGRDDGGGGGPEFP